MLAGCRAEGGLPDAERRPDPHGVGHRGRWAAAVRECRPAARRLVLNAGRPRRWAMSAGLRDRRRLAGFRVRRAGGPDRVTADLGRRLAGCVKWYADRCETLRPGRASGRGDRPGRRRDRRRCCVDNRISGVGAIDARPTSGASTCSTSSSQKEQRDAAAGPGLRVGQPQGVGEDRRRWSLQLLLQPQGRPVEDEGVRHAVHAGTHPDPYPPRGPAARVEDEGIEDVWRRHQAVRRGLPSRRPGLAGLELLPAPSRPRASPPSAFPTA